jgi:hypothetical protein
VVTMATERRRPGTVRPAAFGCVQVRPGATGCVQVRPGATGCVQVRPGATGCGQTMAASWRAVAIVDQPTEWWPIPVEWWPSMSGCAARLVDGLQFPCAVAPQPPPLAIQGRPRRMHRPPTCRLASPFHSPRHRLVLVPSTHTPAPVRPAHFCPCLSVPLRAYRHRLVCQ